MYLLLCLVVLDNIFISFIISLIPLLVSTQDLLPFFGSYLSIQSSHSLLLLLLLGIFSAIERGLVCQIFM